MNYEDAGIIHATEAVGINIARTIITNVANAFGSKGIDLSRYDVARTAVLTKLLNNVPNGYKVCNIKMDIENSAQNTSIHVHAYGSLMRPKRSMVPPMPSMPMVKESPMDPKPNQMQLLPPPPAPREN